MQALVQCPRYSQRFEISPNPGQNFPPSVGRCLFHFTKRGETSRDGGSANAAFRKIKAEIPEHLSLSFSLAPSAAVPVIETHKPVAATFEVLATMTLSAKRPYCDVTTRLFRFAIEFPHHPITLNPPLSSALTRQAELFLTSIIAFRCRHFAEERARTLL